MSSWSLGLPETVAFPLVAVAAAMVPAMVSRASGSPAMLVAAGAVPVSACVASTVPAVVVIVVTVFVNVVGRYFLHAPLRWSDEVAQYLFVWLSYLGALVALVRGRHYSVSNLVDALPRRLRLAMQVFSDLLVIAMLGVLVWFGWALVDRLSFQTSTALRLPIYYVYSALPLTSLLMALVILVQIGERLAGRPARSAETQTGQRTLDERP